MTKSDKLFLFYALSIIIVSIITCILCGIFCEKPTMVAHITFNGELYNYDIIRYFVSEHNVRLKLVDGSTLYLQYDFFYVCKDCHCFG